MRYRPAATIPIKPYFAFNIRSSRGTEAVFMKLQLTIVSAGGEPLPPGSRLRVELRDTSFADAPAVVVTKVDDDRARRPGRTTSVSVPMDVTTVPDGSTVWAHVDVDRDGRVSKGDLISVESYPVTATTQKTTIRLKKVT